MSIPARAQCDHSIGRLFGAKKPCALVPGTDATYYYYYARTMSRLRRVRETG